MESATTATITSQHSRTEKGAERAVGGDGAREKTTLTFAQFTFYWKIDWSSFNGLPEKSLSRQFVTSYENIPLLWIGEYNCLNNFGNTIAFGIFYEGHRQQEFTCSYVLDIIREDHSVVSTFIGNPETWQVVARGNPDALQSKFNLTNSEAFCCKITLKVPLVAFQYTVDFPFLEPSPTWMFNLFENIQTHHPFSNVKFISRDSTTFYCHRSLIEFQSEPLAAMFRQPQSKRDKAGLYDFPSLGDTSLKALLQYLYTGLTTVSALPTSAVVELIDAAEQYGLQPLKKAGIASLWQRVVENPSECPEVIRLADLHEDMKELKLRAMEVLAANYQTLLISNEKFDISDEFGGASSGRRLRNEFVLYVSRRILPCGMTEK